jgi:hypothetical protein
LSPQTILGLLGLALFTALFLAARRVPMAAPSRTGASPGVALPLLFITSVASLNYVVNPFGLFDVHLFEPIVLHSRAAKVKLYLDRRPPPEVVLLGSSPTFTMEPSYVLARTGRPAFNASVHGGTPRDFLAFTRFMLRHGRPPRFLIAAFRVEQFRPDTRVGFEPGDPLESFVAEDPATLRRAMEEAETLLTLEQTEASVRLLAVEVQGRPEPFYRFDADGLGHFKPYSLDEYLESYLVEAAKPYHFRFSDLNPAQLGYLDGFFALCRQNGIGVIAYLAPYHPRLTELWDRQTRLPLLRARLLDELERRQANGGVTVHDFSRVESFGGTDRMFLDALHPDQEASRRMLDILLKDVP